MKKLNYILCGGIVAIASLLTACGGGGSGSSSSSNSNIQTQTLTVNNNTLTITATNCQGMSATNGGSCQIVLNYSSPNGSSTITFPSVTTPLTLSGQSSCATPTASSQTCTLTASVPTASTATNQNLTFGWNSGGNTTIGSIIVSSQ